MQASPFARFSLTGRSKPSDSGADERPVAPETERLPLFTELINSAAASERCVVRDLAAPSKAGMALFNELQCRIEPANFPQELPRLLSAGNAEEFERRMRYALPPCPDHPATVVLCWDFLNYLPRGGITALMEHVANLAQPGAQVHALIAYTATDMPAVPCRHIPDGRTGVQIRPAIDRMCESPRYTPKDLLRCMPRYDIQRGMMLRNGFQEYILRLLA